MMERSMQNLQLMQFCQILIRKTLQPPIKTSKFQKAELTRKGKMNIGFKEKFLSYVKIASYSLCFSTSYAFADDSFNSIGGYSLGQQCTGSEFTNEKTEVRNPSDVLDTIQVKRNIVKSELKGGYKLRVECGIIDNKINYISLTSDNSDDISEIKKSLKEKMGRPADDSENINSEP